MNELCIDANIFISRLTSENSAPLCDQLLEKIDQEQIMLWEPALIVFEVTSTINKKVFLGNMSKESALAALQLFNTYPLLLQWQSFISQKAFELANILKLKTAYDSTYLAVAMAREIDFITMDENFLKKAKTIYKKAFSIQEYLLLDSY